MSRRGAAYWPHFQFDLPPRGIQGRGDHFRRQLAATMCDVIHDSAVIKAGNQLSAARERFADGVDQALQGNPQSIRQRAVEVARLHQ